VQIDLFVCDAIPEPVHEYGIPPAIFAIPADLDIMVVQEPRVLQAGEWATAVILSMPKPVFTTGWSLQPLSGDAACASHNTTNRS
jgi:hypothetical protein